MATWNTIPTDAYEGMIAETVSLRGYAGDSVRTYLSRPLGAGPYPSVVLIAHMPGWDEFQRETARRLTHHGYIVACPDIYCRFGAGTPTEVSQRMRDAGMVPDDTVMGDVEGAKDYLQNLPVSNGKVGVIGMCSGGRHTFLAACRIQGFSAAVDCWGGGVIMPPEDLTPARPVPAIDYAKDLSCPLLGIFGNDDKNPTAQQVDETERILKELGKEYTFERYEGAGHAFFSYTGRAYRPDQCMDAWEKIFDFFGKHLKE